MQRLAEVGERYDTSLDANEQDPGRGRDLRDLHLAAARASLAWTVLGQGAQAVRDEELLAIVTACHPETIRTMKWTVQKLKEASPQILAG